MVVLGLEALPQAVLLSVVYLHWHEPVDTVGLELFSTAVNIPLRFHQLLFLAATVALEVQMLVSANLHQSVTLGTTILQLSTADHS